MADEKRELTAVLKGRDESLGRTLRNVGDESDRTHDKLDNMRAGLNKLDKEIGSTKTTIEGLRDEIRKTGDLELFKDLKKQGFKLRELENMRKALGDEGQRGGKSYVAGIVGNLKELPLQLKGHLIAGVAIGGAASAPFLSSVIAGAVTAGVGAGVVAGGLALAAKSPAVQAAAAGLGKEISDELSFAASPFVPEAIRSIGIVRKELRTLRPELQGLFGDAAPFAQPLARAVTGAVREIVGGLRDATRNAEPLIEVLEEHGPKAAKAFGDALRILSRDAETSAAGFDGFLTSLELLIGGTATTISFLSKIGPAVSSPLYWIGALEDKSKDNAEAADTAAGSWEDYRTAVDNARVAAELMNQALSDLNGLTLDQNEAEREFQEAVDNAREVFDGKVTSLDLGTQKGRDYSAALDNIARKARESGQAIFDTTGDQAAANEKISEGREALIKQAIQYGLTRAQAIAYADKVLAIPKNWTTKINAETAAASRAVRDYKQLLATIARTITTRFNVDAHGNATVFRGLSEGGRVGGPGPKGADSQIRALAPNEHVLTSKEVDAAGGHKVIEQWRKSLLRGTAPAVATRRAVSGGVAGPVVIQIGGGGGGDLDRLFASWLSKLVNTGKIQLRATSSGRVMVG